MSKELEKLPEFINGGDACLGGAYKSNNPHREGTKRWQAWNLGYEFAEKEFFKEEHEEETK